MDHRGGASSLADVSFLLDAPAGKDGFIRVQDGHFVRPDGKRIRFWGVHLTDWSRGSILLPPKEDASMWAATLARFGVNMVRLHFLDLAAPRGIIDSTRNDSRAFDAQQLDRLDFLIAELKKRGIYVDLNLNVGRSYKAGDGVQDFDKIQWGKGLTLFDPRLIELEKEYAKNLLTHVNPYTGTEYRKEPAIAIVEILNENAIYLGYRAPTPYYDDELTKLYNTWLEKKLNAGDLKKLRETAAVAEGAPMPRLKGPEVAAAPKERYDTEMAFFVDLENRFYQDMNAYLKNDLGVKAPITGTADHSHTSSPYTMLASLSKLDIVDGHIYWQHPGLAAAGEYADGQRPAALHRGAAFAHRVRRQAVHRQRDQSSLPQRLGREGIPILAAYGSFQDWDAIILYTFEPKRDPAWKPYVGDPFDISLDPVRMTQMATGALTFLRGDVRAAREIRGADVLVGAGAGEPPPAANGTAVFHAGIPAGPAAPARRPNPFAGWPAHSVIPTVGHQPDRLRHRRVVLVHRGIEERHGDGGHRSHAGAGRLRQSEPEDAQASLGRGRQQLRLHRLVLVGRKAARAIRQDAADGGLARHQYRSEMERAAYARGEPGRVADAHRAGHGHAASARPACREGSQNSRPRWRRALHGRVDRREEIGRRLDVRDRRDADHVVRHFRGTTLTYRGGLRRRRFSRSAAGVNAGLSCIALTRCFSAAAVSPVRQ